jgi:hypothetical protein
MSTTVSDAEQCVALTTDGERCSRPAGDDGFCHQHDSSDETVDEADVDGPPGDGDDAEAGGDGETGGDDAGDGEAVDGEAAGDGTTGDADERETDMSSTESESADTNIGDVRRTVQDTAEGVVGHPLDGITSIDDTEEGWRVAVEVVERKSVPDTQDILGRYEITLDEDLTVTGYQRTHRYRRDDMNHDI